MNKIKAFFQNQPQNSNQAFGLLWTSLFSLIFSWKLITSGEVNLILLSLAALLGIISFFIPLVLYPFNYIWNLIGLSLHKIINPIVMVLIFFLVLTPIALLMKLLGKDFLEKKWHPELQSYWINRDPRGPSPESLSKQF